MKAPQRIMAHELKALRDRWMSEHASRIEIEGEHWYGCLQCGSSIEGRVVCFSVHFAEFGDACAGPGATVEYLIPFCPQCEPDPDDSGCLHVPGTARERT